MWPLLLALMAAWPLVSAAAQDNPIAAGKPAPEFDKLVESERSSLERLRTQKAAELEAFAEKPLPAQALDIAAVEVETEQVRLQGLQLELESLTKSRGELATEIQILGEKLDELARTRPPIDPDTLALIRTTLSNTRDDKRQDEATQGAQQRNTEAIIELSKRKIEILKAWQKALSERYAQYQAKVSEKSFQEKLRDLDEQRRGHIEKAVGLRSLVSSEDAPARQLQIQLDILDAEQNANNIGIEIRLARIREEMRVLLQPVAADESGSLAQFATLEQKGAALAAEVQAVIDTVPSRQQLNANYRSVTEKMPVDRDFPESQKRSELERLARLGTALDEKLGQAQQLATELTRIRQSLQEQKQAQLSIELSERHAWPSSLEDWGKIVRDFTLTLPAAFFVGLTDIVDAIRDASLPRTLGALVILGLLLAGTAELRRYLTRILPPMDRTSTGFSVWTLVTLGYLVKHNLWTITVILVLTTSLRALKVPFESYQPMLIVALVFVVFKPALTLNRLFFQQRFAGFEWYDRPLFEGLRWTFVLGFIMISLSALLHHLPTHRITVDTFDRVLQLALVALSVVLLWRRSVILNFFSEGLRDRPRTLVVLRVLTLVIPIANLVMALTGIAGYVNLAREIAGYEGWFLLVLSGWLIARGYILDFFSWLGPWIRQNAANGWLWQEAVIRPLELVSRLALTITAVLGLIWLWGVAGDISLFEPLQALIKVELFHIGDASIQIKSLLIAGALVVVFLWAIRWSREIAYRWFFRDVADRGARNSLSVFTQYAVALIGGFTLLKALGINMTALTVAAGAIGVGIGFGLQTIANNFISGILLLIERPIRNGDIVNIGAHEGRVTRIGIRSLSVRTWDNMEVIIPNTETITSAFVNWTHLDNIVRTKMMIGASYKADPHAVRELIKGILDRHPGVAKEPPPNVYLNDFGDSSLLFHTEYHVDVSQYSRLQIKSEVLFAVWDAFIKQGIEIPYPQRDVHLRIDREVSDAIAPLGAS
ncbi:MAG: mechanosensitive ion channel domain-containing protein [Thiotrichales bacterium]